MEVSGDAGLILVVEDDYGLCDLVATVLELDSTIRTACAVDAEHALEMVRAMRPGLVILDTRPLKPGGPEIARRLKADPTTQVIPLVGLTSEPLSESGPADACDYHITRPYDLADLVAKLRRPIGLNQEPSVAA